MKRAVIFVLRATEAVVLASLLLAAATIAAAISLARDEDDEEHDCGGTCPAHDVGPDDLEAPARGTGLVVFDVPTLAATIAAAISLALTAHATCPNYVDEIKWGTR